MPTVPDAPLTPVQTPATPRSRSRRVRAWLVRVRAKLRCEFSRPSALVSAAAGPRRTPQPSVATIVIAAQHSTEKACHAVRSAIGQGECWSAARVASRAERPVHTRTGPCRRHCTTRCRRCSACAVSTRVPHSSVASRSLADYRDSIVRVPFRRHRLPSPPLPSAPARALGRRSNSAESSSGLRLSDWPRGLRARQRSLARSLGAD